MKAINPFTKILVVVVFLCFFLQKCRKKELHEGFDITLNGASQFSYRADTIRNITSPINPFPLKLRFELVREKGVSLKANHAHLLSESLKFNHIFYLVLNKDTLELGQPTLGDMAFTAFKGKEYFLLYVPLFELQNNFDSIKYTNYRMYMDDLINNGDVYYRDYKIKKTKSIDIVYLDPSSIN